MIYDVFGLFMGLQFLGSMVDGCWLVFYDLIFMCFWWFLVACLKINANKSINTKPECRLRTCLNINLSCVNKSAFNQVQSIFYSHEGWKMEIARLVAVHSIYTREGFIWKKMERKMHNMGVQKLNSPRILCTHLASWCRIRFFPITLSK